MNKDNAADNIWISIKRSSRKILKVRQIVIFIDEIQLKGSFDSSLLGKCSGVASEDAEN